jgi:hypothetical protein
MKPLLKMQSAEVFLPPQILLAVQADKVQPCISISFLPDSQRLWRGMVIGLPS